MKLIYVIALLISSGSSAVEKSEPKQSSCPDLNACLIEAKRVAQPSEASYLSLNSEERSVAHRLTAFGAEAVPGLLKLLADPDENVSQIAGYALRDIEGIDEKYLPELMAGVQRGDGWLPPAIGRIKTPEAGRFLAEQLALKPENNTQLTYALRLSGTTAVPYLAEISRCPTACEEKLFWTVAAVLEDMGEDASIGIDDFLRNAQDVHLAEHVRTGNIRLLGAIGEPAARVVPALLKLGSISAEIREAVSEALFGIRSPEAVQMVAEQLKSAPNNYLLRDISRLGRNGKAAGSFITPLLQHESWDVRNQAAETLGDIGFDPAGPTLIATLSSSEDWRLVAASAIALGKLQFRDALPQLRQLELAHWFPGVRYAAGMAVRHIESGQAPDKQEDRIFSDTYYDSDKVKLDTCQSVASETMKEPSDQKLYKDEQSAQLAALTFMRSYDDWEPTGNGDDFVRIEKTVEESPKLALRVENGWLLGTNRGEFGGEVVFRHDNGDTQIFLRENVEDIYRFGDDFVAVTGIAHLGINEGVLYRIAKQRGGWSATPWRALPGAPATSWLVEGGELLVNTLNGSVLISYSGKMQMAKCKSVR